MAPRASLANGTKRCDRCHLVQPLRAFRKDDDQPGGVGRRCRTCLGSTVGRRKRRVSSRNLRIAKTYGLTDAEYQALLAAQGGCCAICGGRRSYNLAVDHCHSTGEIRGLLCKQCNNRLLPTVKDDITLLERAVAYLTFPPARGVFGAARIIPDHADDDALRKRTWKAGRARPAALDPEHAEELSLFEAEDAIMGKWANEVMGSRADG